MRLADRFLRFFNRFTRDPKPVDQPWFFNGMTQAGVRVTPDVALKTATVWACVGFLSRSVGQLPWRVMRAIPKGTERLDAHPVARLLHSRPCPEMGAFSWRETMVVWAAMRGNAVAEIVRDQRGSPAALYPIHPDRIEFDRTPEGELVYVVNNEGGNQVKLSPRDVFHLRGFGDGPVGVNVVAYAAESIGWARATELFGSAFFGEGTNPSGVLKSKGKLTPDGMEYLRNEVKRIYGGPRNAQKTLILDAEMDWQKISSTPGEAQFIETRQHQVEEICRWFGVPPHKVMHLLRATFSNIEHQAIEVVVDSIVPWAMRLEQEADYKLFGGNREQLFTKLEVKGLLRGDFKSRSEGYRILRETGVLSVNEIRELEDLNTIGAEGDKRLAPMNYTTLERIGEEPVAAAASPVPRSNGNEDDEDNDLQDSVRIQAAVAGIMRAAEITAAAMRASPAPIVNVAGTPVTVNVPEQPAPVVNVAPSTVTVNVPEQPAPVVNVAPAAVNVNVPDQAAPIVNVAPAAVSVNVPEQAAPVVNVSVPEAAPPRITVKVPEQAAPVVNVAVPKVKKTVTRHKRDKRGELQESETEHQY